VLFKLLTISLYKPKLFFYLYHHEAGEVKYSGLRHNYSHPRYQDIASQSWPLYLPFVCFFPLLAINLVQPCISLQFRVHLRPLFAFHSLSYASCVYRLLLFRARLDVSIANSLPALCVLIVPGRARVVTSDVLCATTSTIDIDNVS